MKNFKTFTVYCNADEAVVIADVLADYQKQIKDLETANARLFERNHELQVDNEEFLKEVEAYSKRCDELRSGIVDQAKDLIKQFRLVKELQYDQTTKNEVIENLQSLLDNARDEIEHLHKHNGDLARAGLSSPKSKFVITVEEF